MVPGALSRARVREQWCAAHDAMTPCSPCLRALHTVRGMCSARKELPRCHRAALQDFSRRGGHTFPGGLRPYLLSFFRRGWVSVGTASHMTSSVRLRAAWAVQVFRGTAPVSPAGRRGRRERCSACAYRQPGMGCMPWAGPVRFTQLSCRKSFSMAWGRKGLPTAA